MDLSGIPDGVLLTIPAAEIAVPCPSRSPLLSTNNLFGMAFTCKHNAGHDGNHAQTITWESGGYENVEIGRMELTWTA